MKGTIRSSTINVTTQSRVERLHLGRESSMVWVGLFNLKNPKDLLGSKMGMWAKSGGGMQRKGGEETKKNITTQLWKWGVK